MQKNIILTTRIIDANLNRIREGIRVIEDILRFHLHNKIYIKELKKIRHEITSLIPKVYDEIDIVKYREAVNDPGRKIKLKTEQERTSLRNVLLANFKRIEESLRVLEEIIKLKNTDVSEEIKKIRFKVYTLEKKVLIYTAVLVYPSLVLIINNLKELQNIKSFQYINGVIFNCRKFVNDKEIYNQAFKIKKICKNNNLLFFIQGRIDIALLTETDGIYLTKDDLNITLLKKKMVYTGIIAQEFYPEISNNEIKLSDFLVVNLNLLLKINNYGNIFIKISSLDEMKKLKNKKIKANIVITNKKIFNHIEELLTYLRDG